MAIRVLSSLLHFLAMAIIDFAVDFLPLPTAIVAATGTC